MESLSKKEQASDSKAEQEAHPEEKEQQLHQLPEPQRPAERLTFPTLLGLMSTYLFFLTALFTFGMLAYYSGHNTTLQLVFYISIPLLLVTTAFPLWYWRSLFKKKPAKTVAPSKPNRLVRFGQALQRIGNNRIVKIYDAVSPIIWVAYGIYSFPQHPRESLILIVISTSFFFVWAIIQILSELESRIKRVDERVWDFIQQLVSGLNKLHDTYHKIHEADLRTHKVISDRITNHSDSIAKLSELAGRIITLVERTADPSINVSKQLTEGSGESDQHKEPCSQNPDAPKDV